MHDYVHTKFVYNVHTCTMCIQTLKFSAFNVAQPWNNSWQHEAVCHIKVSEPRHSIDEEPYTHSSLYSILSGPEASRSRGNRQQLSSWTLKVLGSACL